MPSTDEKARLVVVQGPLEALTAVSAVLHREARGHVGMRNVLLVGDLYTADREGLKRAIISCARGIVWDRAVDSFGIADGGKLRERIGLDTDVAEILCVRNYTPLNELALRTFGEALKISYGDGLGLIDARREDSAPQFDLVVAPLPQPLARGTMDGLPWEVVAREHFVAGVDAARDGLPDLRALDAELAQFAAGGILALTDNRLATEFGTTLRGEAHLGFKLIRRTAPEAHTPIVLKPHPRATGGQTGAIARLLRDAGHPVRVITSHPLGRYPIELFRDLLHAVAATRSIASSSTLSLKYLYGLDTDVEVPRALAHLHIAPYDVTRFLAGARYYDEIRGVVEGWQGDALLPPLPRVKAPVPARAVYRLSGPILWRLVRDLPTRDTRWRPEMALRALLGHTMRASAGVIVVDDAEAALCWRIDRLPGENAERLRQSVVRAGGVEERVSGTLAALDRRPAGRAALAAGVLPPSHLPAWRQKLLRRAGVPVPAGTELTMAQLEDVLEVSVEVVAAVPTAVGPRAGAVASRLRTPAGHAAFVFRTRAPAGPFGDDTDEQRSADAIASA